MKRGFLIFLSFLVIGTVTATGCDSGASSDSELRIGYQKFGTFSVLKARGTLEKKLESQGMKVKWIQFPAGPQLLEALKTGSIDLGHAGDAPPVFAQAAGTPLVYIGVGARRPEGEAVVVHRNSPIKSIKDLKGKKVALNKGSNVHYLLVKALEKEGLSYEEIQPVYLPPGDARPAFAKKSVDAWVIWDPFYSALEKDLGVRTLQNAEGITSNREFYFADKTFADRSKKEVNIFLDELEKTADWINKHPDEAAKLLSGQVGMDSRSVKKALRRAKYGVEPIDDSVVREQQQIADTFARFKLISGEIDIETVVWSGNRVKR